MNLLLTVGVGEEAKVNVPPVSLKSCNPSFGILKGTKKTPYGEYTWGVFRNKKIEVFDAYKNGDKLWFVSEIPTFKWLKYKFAYLKDGKKIVDKREVSYFRKDY